MRFRTRLPFRLLLLAWLLLPCAALAQQVTISVPGGALIPGQQVTATAKITNTLTPRAPITLTAGGTYQDWTGAVIILPTVSIQLNVIQPLTFSQLTMTLPSSLTYVLGSATSTVPVTGTVTNGVLTLAFPLAPPITEGQSLSITCGLAVAK
jgi:hypothetical protein